MVKDLRTDTEDTNPQNVLNGEIDLFLSASLAQEMIKLLSKDRLAP